jgi:hypothetical protein
MGEIDIPQCTGGPAPRRRERQRAGCCIRLNARAAVGPIRTLEPKKEHPWELSSQRAASEAAFL